MPLSHVLFIVVKAARNRRVLGNVRVSKPVGIDVKELHHRSLFMSSIVDHTEKRVASLEFETA